MFVLALADAPLPRETLARLMQHYERIGEFGKAEDALTRMNRLITKMYQTNGNLELLMMIQKATE